MGKIPEANFGDARLSTNVGTVPYQSAEGELAQIQAYSNLGQSVAKLGMDLGKIRQKANQNDYINRVTSDYAVKSAANSNELNVKFAGDPLKIPEAEKEFSEKFKISALNDAPDDVTRQTLEQELTKRQSNEYLHSLSRANKLNADILKANDAVYEDNEMASIAIKPNAANMAQIYNSSQERKAKNLGVLYSQAELIENTPRLADRSGTTFVSALRNSTGKGRLASLQHAKDFLNGKVVEGATVYKDMSTETILDLQKKVDNDIESELAVSEAEVTNTIDSALAQAVQFDKPLDVEGIDKAINLTYRLKDGGAEQRDSLTTIKKFGQVFEEIKAAPPSKREAILAEKLDVGDKVFNLEKNKHIRDLFKKNIDEYIVQSKKYPTINYVSTPTGKMLSAKALDFDDVRAAKEYTTNLESWKKAENLTEMPTVLTPELVTSARDFISASVIKKNPQALDASIQRINTNFGAQALVDIKSDEPRSPLNTEFFIISKISDSNTRISMYDSMLNTKYKELDKNKRDVIESQISSNTKFKNFTNALSDGGGSKQEIEAYKNIIRESAAHHGDTTKAIEGVMTGLSPEEVGNSTLIIDKKLNPKLPDMRSLNDTVISSTFSSNEQNMYKLLKGGMSDAHYKRLVETGKTFGMTKEQLSVKKAFDVSKRGRFILDRSGNFMQLVINNDNGDPVPVYDAEGKRVKVPINDIKKTIIEITGNK